MFVVDFNLGFDVLIPFLDVTLLLFGLILLHDGLLLLHDGLMLRLRLLLRLLLLLLLLLRLSLLSLRFRGRSAFESDCFSLMVSVLGIEFPSNCQYRQPSNHHC